MKPASGYGRQIDKAPRDVKRLAAILNAPTYDSRAWTGRK